jgi:PAS domain S-box-containing protein/putative nucleotidyltransferase with HDIG domain
MIIEFSLDGGTGMKKCRCTRSNTSNNKTAENSISNPEINDALEASYEQLKSTTQQLYESEQKYKLLIDNMTDIIWIIDIRGNIAFINNEIENILGYKKEVTLGSPLYNFMCPLHQYENCSDIISEMRNRDFYKQELWMLHSDGTTRKVIETNTRRIYDNGTLIGVQGVGRDATERIYLERRLKQNNLNTIKTLIAAIEAKDTYTQGHSIRVSQYSVKMARELGMTSEEIEEIEIAGILHDIGKIGISDEILTKPGVLEPYEFDMVKEHPSIGCRILQPIGLSENIINATLLHHKRFDLQGYPKDVHIGELPLIASIICTADAYDAMTSNRSYKPLMTAEEAIEELRRYSGTQFSPDTVKIMEKLYEKKLI